MRPLGMTTKEGTTVNVYDTITADQIEVADQILVNDIDPIEVSDVVDSGDSIMVKGYSHMTGDNACYILAADTEVSLWAV